MGNKSLVNIDSILGRLMSFSEVFNYGIIDYCNNIARVRLDLCIMALTKSVSLTRIINEDCPPDTDAMCITSIMTGREILWIILICVCFLLFPLSNYLFITCANNNDEHHLKWGGVGEQCSDAFSVTLPRFGPLVSG